MRPLSALPAVLLCAAPALATSALPAHADARRVETANDADDDAAQEVDPRTADRRRVLHLAGGGVLRGRSKWTGEAWSVRVDGKWTTVSAGDVARTRIERELLDEAARLGADLDDDDHGRRVMYADWLANEGLVPEALDALDVVLRAEPDHEAALALIERRAFPVESARGREMDDALYRDLILGGGRARPVEREVILRLLERSVRGETLRATFEHELTALGPERRDFAALAHRRLFPGENTRELLRRCALDGSGRVRAASARTLAANDAPELALPLIRALDSESPAVRTNAAESLGHLGVRAAVPALVARYSALAQGGGAGSRPPAANIFVGTQFAYVRDFDVEIAQGASIADPDVATQTVGAVLDVRVGGISGWTTIREARTVRGALERLTGAEPGHAAADWERWLAEHGDALERPKPPVTGGGGDE